MGETGDEHSARGGLDEYKSLSCSTDTGEVLLEVSASSDERLAGVSYAARKAFVGDMTSWSS